MTNKGRHIRKRHDVHPAVRDAALRRIADHAAVRDHAQDVADEADAQVRSEAERAATLGLTITEIANAAGVSRALVHLWLRPAEYEQLR